MTTGTDAIRAKIIAANKKLQLARFIQECGLTASQFDAFIAGKSIPPAASLCLMAKWLFPHSRFDPERNLLISGNEEKPKPLGSALPFNPALVGALPGNEHRGLKMPKDKKPPATRPGWG